MKEREQKSDIRSIFHLSLEYCIVTGFGESANARKTQRLFINLKLTETQMTNLAMTLLYLKLSLHLP